MKQFIPLEKRSKKQQRAFYQLMRESWHEFSPVTRVVPNGKRYRRKKRVTREEYD